MIEKIKQNKDLMYFVSNAPYKFLKAVSIILSSFVITWYLANFASRELLGQYQFILSTIGLFAVFSFSGIKDAILQSVAKGYDYSLIKGTKYSIRFLFIGSLLLSILGAYYYIFRKDISLSVSFLIVAALFPSFYAFEGFTLYLCGKFQFRRELIFTVLIRATLVISIFLSILLFGTNIIILVAIYLISQILPSVFFFNVCRREIKEEKDDQDLVRYGWFLTKVNGLIEIANNIDKFMIGLLISPSILAVYSIGTTIPDKLKGVITTMLYIFFPAFSRNDIKLNKKKVICIFLFSCGISLLTLVLLPIFIKILFPDYQESIKYGMLYSIVILFFPLNIVFEYYFKGKKEGKGIRNPLLFSRIFVIISSVPAILMFNLAGALVVRILGQVINSLLNLYYYKLEER